MSNASNNGSLPPSNPVRLWMPFYPGDYLRDTIDLTLSQHGAYFKALMFYWVKGGALTKDELRGICHSEFERVSKFFVLCDGLWHHKRVDIELAKALEMHQRQREKALKGVEAKRKLRQVC